MKFFTSPGASPVATFQMEKVSTQALGVISRPVAYVSLWSDVDNTWYQVKMLIDTGADYTLLPRYMGLWFAQEKNDKNQQVTIGLGGNQKVHFLNDIKVKVGHTERVIPVGIATTSKVPPLMGRHLFFETFKVEFDHSQRVTFF